MFSFGVVHADDVAFESVDDELCSGLVEAHLIGPEEGALHLDVSFGQLEPGGVVEGHLHPFEESFYVLDGEALLTVADGSYSLGPGSFGYAPIATAHAWANRSDAPVRWLRTRSPVPRVIGDAAGTHPAPDTPAPVAGASVTSPDRARRFVGQFAEEMMNEPGSLQMKGFSSPAPTNVSVWMMVDEVMGAVHHTKFSVRFDPTQGGMTLGGQHFHPFEETYYVTSGRAVAHLEDESHEVGPGDVVFAGVGALHGFTNPGHEPVRWIEMQAPCPPTSGAFFFAGQWAER